MHFSQYAQLLLVLVIPYLAFGIPVSKRWQIHIEGDLVTQDEINAYINQIAALAQYVVDNVHPNHALYLRFFGSSNFYAENMAVFNRLARIRQDRNSQTVDINLLRGNGPDAVGANGAAAPAAAQYIPVGQQPGVTRPTLNVYEQIVGLGDVLDEAPSNVWQGQLDRFQATRQGVILHELMHFAGDSALWGPVVADPARFNGPPNIVDIAMAHGALGQAADQQYLVQQGVDIEHAVAYQERNVLILSQLTGRDLTVVNADTYTLFALALFIGWNGLGQNPPTHQAPDGWDGKNDSDPFGPTGPPFDGLDEAARYKANMFWSVLGRHTEL